MLLYGYANLLLLKIDWYGCNGKKFEKKKLFLR